MTDEKKYVERFVLPDGEEVYLKGQGGGLEIGDIGIAPFGIDESLNKRRYLNGQIINAETYPDFANLLTTKQTLYPSLFTTETNWQAEVTSSELGQCGKFVLNYTTVDSVSTLTSIRLPKVVNINGCLDLQNVGTIKDQTLPNVTGALGYNILTDGSASPPETSAIQVTGSYKTGGGGSAFTARGMSLNLNTNNPNYQDNAPVQQEAIQYPYFIQVATGAETEDNIINEIELNNPFSLLDYKYSEYELNNISWLRSNGQYNSKAIYPAVYDLLFKIYNGTETKAGVSVKLSTETFTDYDFVLNTAEETFRLPIKVKLASGKAVVGNGMTLGLTNGTQNAGLREFSANNIVALTTSNIGYGQPVSTTATVGSNIGYGNLGVTTDATKSGIETSDSDLYLYFYVGETVQNANLINAGRIEEKIIDINSRPYITETYENGTSGYVVYSNGLCEQWGIQSAAATGYETTIELLKPYKDTNYITLKTFSISTNTQAFYTYISIYSKTVNNFKTGNTSGIENWSWFTKGYIS